MVFTDSIIISDDETQQHRALELSCPSPLLLQWGADASLSRLGAWRDSSSLLVSGDCQGQDSRAGEAPAKAPLGFWAWGYSADAPLLLAQLPRALHNSPPMSFGWIDGTLPPCCSFTCCLSAQAAAVMSLDSREVHLHQPAASGMAERASCSVTHEEVGGESGSVGREPKGASWRGSPTLVQFLANGQIFYSPT